MSLRDYSRSFDVLEVQSTFYRLPMLKTAERWRSIVQKSFEFTIKAFQGITHPISSPTWKRAGKQRPTKNVENYGFLRPTKENFECWSLTHEIASILRVKICVIQLPPSFIYSKENIQNATEFLDQISDGIRIWMEFRDDSWIANAPHVSRMLSKSKVIHIVDPLRTSVISRSDLGYYRLHGLGKRLYKYKYSRRDLEKLKIIVRNTEADCVYVMFNNIHMKDDAVNFAKMVQIH